MDGRIYRCAEGFQLFWMLGYGGDGELWVVWLVGSVEISGSVGTVGSIGSVDNVEVMSGIGNLNNSWEWRI